QYLRSLFRSMLTSTFWTPEPVPFAEPETEVRLDTVAPLAGLVTDDVGSAVSIVTLRAVEPVLVLPARSVALAVMLCVPLLRVLLVMVQLPLPSATAVPF